MQQGAGLRYVAHRALLNALATWLDPNLTDPDKATKLLQRITVEPMEIRPVSRDVNTVGTNRPDLIDPAKDAVDTPLQLALA